MYRFFSLSHAYYLKNHFRNPRFLSSFSHLYNPTKTLVSNSKLGFILDEVEEHRSSESMQQRVQLANEIVKSPDRREYTFEESSVRISHPWPEWVDLMECLLDKGYIEADSLENGEMGAKDSNRIRTACLNFARDRFDLIRYFSRKDILVVARSGCPSIDRKVVNSGKRLRAHVGVDEGNVCSSCSLRGNCERAYVKAREDEGGRTVDVMRILLTYGLDPFISSVENKQCLDKTVNESVRRLLKEMLKLSVKELISDPLKATTSRLNSPVQEHSTPQEKGHNRAPMKQDNWTCPKCNFLNFSRNIKCLRCNTLVEGRLKNLGENQDYLPLKKGDWLCDKCNFLNFAKNTRCLQCKEKPPKRQLNPGEWECDSCNYINFRRNMVCLKCDHRRPKASYHSDTAAEPYREDGPVCQPRGIRNEFEDEHSDRRERQNRNKNEDIWRFVEDEGSDHDECKSWNGNLKSGFVDFPILGGKSELSQSAENRDRWKMEMSGRDREGEDGDEFRNDRGLEFLVCSDDDEDDEMAQWFGRRKVEMKKLPYPSHSSPTHL